MTKFLGLLGKSSFNWKLYIEYVVPNIANIVIHSTAVIILSVIIRLPVCYCTVKHNIV
jgi:hypothetical protein